MIKDTHASGSGHPSGSAKGTLGLVRGRRCLLQILAGNYGLKIPVTAYFTVSGSGNCISDFFVDLGTYRPSWIKHGCLVVWV